MGRPVFLGNGSLTVGLNEQGLVHDFYYPYVGLDNLTTARSVHHKIGVWVDGQFSWVDDGTWLTKVTFQDNALISDVQLENGTLEVKLAFRDFVDPLVNAFCRQVTVTNLAGNDRTIRLFMHQVFQISRAGRADTALFEPEAHYLLDYKGRCCLLIYSQNADNQEIFDQYSVGSYGIEGKEGTYRDAEDGELSNNPVEHGGVDSVLRHTLNLTGNEAATIDYWIVAADSQYSAEAVHSEIKEDGLTTRLKNTENFWHDWLDPVDSKTKALSEEQRQWIRKSLMVIKAHTDKRGGIIASCDSSIYNYGRDYYSYVWPRDGAYAMWPLIRLGYTEEPKKFFEFCRDIIHPDGYMLHKYQPDRAIGSTWHPLVHGIHTELAIQEDETAIVIYMLGVYLETSGDEEFVSSLYGSFIQPAGRFMAKFRDASTGLPHASYDLWEEKFLTNTYTVAVVHRALLTAADMAEKFAYPDDAHTWRMAAQEIAAGCHVFFDTEQGALRKGYLLQDDGSLAFDNTLDVSSLFGAFVYAPEVFAEAIQSTLEVTERNLLNQSPSGGAPRYTYDHYFAADPAYYGNPWFVTTLWLAQHYIQKGELNTALPLIDWALAHALPSGVLSEQVNPTDGSPLSVAPLVWSHAELINTLLDLQSKTQA